MAFTEFYCDASAGSNLNGGDTAGAVEVAALAGTYNRGTGAGGTDRFTAASGTPFSGIAAGRFVAVRAASGAAPADFAGRITAVNGGGSSIDISLTAVSGTRPSDAASVDARVGGSWQGPNAAVTFPFGFVTNALTDAAGDKVRVNFKNNATYSITANMTHNLGGPIVFEGYTTTVGDLGRATIDGGTSGTSFEMLTFGASANDFRLASFVFQNNGSSGSSAGVNISLSPHCSIFNCVFANLRGSGLTGGGSPVGSSVRCEAYGCNQSNTSNTPGFAADMNYVNCIAHDNAGSNTDGFRPNQTGSRAAFTRCISDSNGRDGFGIASAGDNLFTSCDAYNNGQDGINFAGNGRCVLVESSNFVKNGRYGINASGSGSSAGGIILNCGFGSGTQINVSGDINLSGREVVIGKVVYASGVTPWVDPANGDFRVNLAAAKGAGDGTFVQTASSYAGTVAYPDIGAGQHLDAGGGGGKILRSSIIEGLGVL